MSSESSQQQLDLFGSDADLVREAQANQATWAESRPQSRSLQFGPRAPLQATFPFASGPTTEVRN
jgi:hypothetical protein